MNRRMKPRARLSLARETLRTLADHQLGRPAGGAFVVGTGAFCQSGISACQWTACRAPCTSGIPLCTTTCSIP
jgi:hypothetical protein